MLEAIEANGAVGILVIVVLVLLGIWLIRHI